MGIKSESGDEGNSRRTGRGSGERRATLKEVAATVGVSVATVSNAYNRPDQLSPEMRERVMAAAEELGYSGPDPFGRGLRRGKAGAIGVLYTDRLSYAFTDPAAVMFLEGVSRAAEEAGLGMLLLPGGPLYQRERESVVGAAVDGFVVYCVAEDDPLLKIVLQRNIPAVFVDLGMETQAASIGIDDAGGASQLAEHLVGLGHRRFGVVSFHFDAKAASGMASVERQAEITNIDTRARLDGFRRVLERAPLPLGPNFRLDGISSVVEKAGIDWREVPVYEARENNPLHGRIAAGELLDLEDPPTAIFALSDQLAFGVMEEAQSRGLEIPGDISVVGFDDVPEASRSNPPLTTVRQPHVDKGRIAGERLISIIAGDEVTGGKTQILPIELMVRQSTGPAKDRN